MAISLPAMEKAFCLRQREGGFRSLVLRLHIDEVETRQIALRDQGPLRFEFGLALIEQSFSLRDLRLARFVGQDRDDLALEPRFRGTVEPG